MVAFGGARVFAERSLPSSPGRGEAEGRPEPVPFLTCHWQSWHMPAGVRERHLLRAG